MKKKDAVDLRNATSDPKEWENKSATSSGDHFAGGNSSALALVVDDHQSRNTNSFVGGDSQRAAETQRAAAAEKAAFPNSSLALAMDDDGLFGLDPAHFTAWNGGNDEMETRARDPNLFLEQDKSRNNIDSLVNSQHAKAGNKKWNNTSSTFGNISSSSLALDDGEFDLDPTIFTAAAAAAANVGPMEWTIRPRRARNRSHTKSPSAHQKSATDFNSSKNTKSIRKLDLKVPTSLLQGNKSRQPICDWSGSSHDTERSYRVQVIRINTGELSFHLDLSFGRGSVHVLL